LQKYSSELGISDIQSQSCCYITFKAKDDSGENVLNHIRAIIARDGIDKKKLVSDSECPVFEKYDEYISPELLREAYASDKLFTEEIIERFS
jgi:hypothetical protein